MSLILDARPVVTAALAALNAALSGSEANAYTFDTIPGSPRASTPALRSQPLPAIYVAMTAERMYLPVSSLSGETGMVGWRLIARPAGRTENEARWAQSRIFAALNERPLVVGLTDTQVSHESSESPEWDELRYVGRDLFTCAL